MLTLGLLCPDLAATEPYWKGWFTGLSKQFLSAPTARLLIVADTDRLDTELQIAQMQGKFQWKVLGGGAGHCVQEDKPGETAAILAEFARFNRFGVPIVPFKPPAKKPATATVGAGAAGAPAAGAGVTAAGGTAASGEQKTEKKA